MEDDSVFSIIERYWNRAPVEIESIIRDAGLVYEEESLWPTESGLIERWGDSYRIVVNSDHSNVRRRFTAAHELGHYVYHRDLIGDGISDAAYRTGESGRYHNSMINQRHETQANKFAATVLMPINLIRRLEHEKNLPLPARIADMARLLEVSEQALRIRLGLVTS
jgi:Zn-dependent peptidase ImmA (M78 family)